MKRIAVAAFAAVGIVVWIACATTAEEELWPVLGPAVAREICEVQFPVVASDSSVIGVASVEYIQELVLAAAGNSDVYDDVYPNDTLFHWQQISEVRDQGAFRCGQNVGVRISGGSGGRSSWHILRGGMLFSVALNRGDEPTACAVLRQLLDWEGPRGRGLVVRPEVQQLYGGEWVKTQGYQGGIFYDYFQTERDTVTLRMQFAPLGVVYGAENVQVSFDRDAASESVQILIAKPRDGYWPWNREAPQFFKVFSADTVSAFQWFRVSYVRGKGSYTFSLEVTPSETGGRIGIPQGLLFKGTAKAQFRGLNPECNQIEFRPTPADSTIGILPFSH